MFAYLQIIARCYNCQCCITGCRDSTGCHTEDGICCGRCGLARARRVRGAGPEVSSGFDPLISPTLERANIFQLTIAPSSVMSSAPADKLWAHSEQHLNSLCAIQGVPSPRRKLQDSVTQYREHYNTSTQADHPVWRLGGILNYVPCPILLIEIPHLSDKKHLSDERQRNILDMSMGYIYC